MKLIKNINAVLIVPFFTVILLSLPISAHADWSNADMHPMMAPTFNPHQGQPVPHEVHVNVPQRIEPQQRLEPSKHTQSYSRPEQPVNRRQDTERHVFNTPGYFHRDADYYGHADVVLPYSDVDSSFVVPDGFEVVTVNGENFYYNRGVFYQQVGGQLTAIPAVLGAVVDYIPQDYQIIMADGVHYLFTVGVYYQRVEQGFEVVQPPVSDQE